MIRLGLCCIFNEQPIKFRSTTVKSLSQMSREDALDKLSGICLHNANSLLEALTFCSQNGIGCFRVTSRILPVKTHSEQGYEVSDLPQANEIMSLFSRCKEFAQTNNIRTCFHPDQFVVLNSPKSEVVESSVSEIEYQSEVAEWIGADVVNIHGGGAYGDKKEALKTLAKNLELLSDRARSKLTLENDDKTFTPEDLYDLCKAENVPLVYDVHHHRCTNIKYDPKVWSIQHATARALHTWDREPLFHLSSPIEGWDGVKPQRHHDFIDLTDFPTCWESLNITVEVEAKAKEIAVLQLKEQLDTLERGY